MTRISSRSVARLCMALAMLLLATGCGDLGGLLGGSERPPGEEDATPDDVDADESPAPDETDDDEPPDAEDHEEAHSGDAADMVEVDPDALLDGSAGSGDLRVRESGDPIPSEEGPFPDQGTFRVFCQLSHMNFDDPIVFPGEVGASHGHQFVGNTETDANSTAESIATGGNSTCTGGIADRSAYWTPVIVDTGTGEIVRPQIMAAYYQSGFSDIDAESIQAIPEGLMMIAGDPTRTPGEDDSGSFRGFNNARWACFGGGGGGPQTQGDGTAIPDCGGESVSMIINFPQCWDGENLDTDDQSHMAYPTRGECPESHPEPIPSLMQFWIFPPEDGDTSDWRLSSDMYSADQPGGASVHADFVNGWDPEIMDRWLNACIRPELDCERAELGDGEGLF